MQKRTIRQYYLLSALTSLVGIQLISAVYATFLMRNGLSLFEVNLVNAVYFTTLFICEIPTGAFADIFGRKTSYVLSAAVFSLGMAVYGSSETLIGFICAEAIAAIGMTFRTGAFQSWLVDSLKHQGYRGSFRGIFGRATLYSQIAGSIGAVMGAYLSAFHAPLPWLVGSLGMALVASLALLFMKEEYFVRESFSWSAGAKAMKATVATSFRYAAEDKAVRFILTATFVQIYAVQALNMYWQPYFTGHGVRPEHLGYIFIGMMFFLALGPMLVIRIRSEGKERMILLSSMLYVGGLAILSSLSTAFAAGLTFFLLHETGRGMWAPLADSYLHHRIPSHERATIISFCSVAPHIGGAMGLLISGAIAEIWGIRAAWCVAGAVLIVGACAVWKNGHDPIHTSDLH